MNYQIKAQVSREGSSVYLHELNGKRTALNSLYSPEKEMNRFFESEIEILEKKLVVIVGVGNGLLIEKLLQSKALQKNVHFLLIEPFSEIIIAQNVKELLSNHSNKVSFFYLNKINSLLFSQYLTKYTSISICIQIHPNYLRANNEKIKEVIQVIKEGISTKKILNNTERKFALDWIIEPLLNTKIMDKSVNIKHLKNRFEGETAILVAAGPSLHQNISFIKKMQHSCHIFAVGPAIRPLLKNNIHPDYGLSIDSSQTNYEAHFKDLCFEGTLIFETMSNHRIQKEHKGKLIDCNALSDHLSTKLFNDNYGFPHAVPSVAIFVLQVIKFFGFKEVYLVGQDLALINGEYYSEGVKKHEGVNDTIAELTVINNRDEKIGTTRALKIFLEAFEKMIKTFPDESMKIYNISEYGAKIEGTEFVSPDKIEKKTQKKMVQIENRFNVPNQPISEFVVDFINQLENIKNEIKKANDELKMYIDTQRVSKDEQLQVLKTFKEICKNEIIERVIMSNLTFMFDNIINKFIYFDEKEQYTEEDLLIQIKELSNLYEVIEKYTEEILNDERIKNIEKTFF